MRPAARRAAPAMSATSVVAPVGGCSVMGGGGEEGVGDGVGCGPGVGVGDGVGVLALVGVGVGSGVGVVDGPGLGVVVGDGVGVADGEGVGGGGVGEGPGVGVTTNGTVGVGVGDGSSSGAAHLIQRTVSVPSGLDQISPGPRSGSPVMIVPSSSSTSIRTLSSATRKPSSGQPLARQSSSWAPAGAADRTRPATRKHASARTMSAS